MVRKRLGKRGSTEVGMTLVEVMVTLGIASVMMLGILQIVDLSMRSSRNVTQTAEWNNFLQNVRLSMGSETNCSRVIGSKGNGAPNDPFTEVYSMVSAMGGATPVLTSKTNASHDLLYAINTWFVPGSLSNQRFFRVTGVSLDRPTTDMDDNRILLVDENAAGRPLRFFRVKRLDVSFTAQKVSSGGARHLGSETMTGTVPLRFIVGPVAEFATPNAIMTASEDDVYICGGVNIDVTQAVCQSLGGTYNPAPPPGQTQCTMDEIRFFDYVDNSNVPTLSAAEPGSTPVGGRRGARLRLWGTSNNAQPDDYAIGVNTGSMWFNIGGTGSPTHHMSPVGATDTPVSEFVWNYAVDADGPANDRPLMSLDAGGMLMINPEDATDFARVALGRAQGSGFPDVRLESFRSDSAEGMNLMMITGGLYRMNINRTGAVMIGSDDLGTASLTLRHRNDLVAAAPPSANMAGISSPQTGGPADGSLRLLSGGLSRVNVWRYGQVAIGASDTIVANTVDPGSGVLLFRDSINVANAPNKTASDSSGFVAPSEAGGNRSLELWARGEQYLDLDAGTQEIHFRKPINATVGGGNVIHDCYWNSIERNVTTYTTGAGPFPATVKINCRTGATDAETCAGCPAITWGAWQNSNITRFGPDYFPVSVSGGCWKAPAGGGKLALTTSMVLGDEGLSTCWYTADVNAAQVQVVRGATLCCRR